MTTEIENSWKEVVRNSHHQNYCSNFGSFVIPHKSFTRIKEVYFVHDTDDGSTARQNADRISALDQGTAARISIREHALRFFWKCLSLQEANPNSRTKVNRLSTFTSMTHSELELKGELNLQSETASRERTIIFLQGPRGSGKSTTINRLLSLNKHDFDERKTIFVRCDASKLYRAAIYQLKRRNIGKQQIIDRFSIDKYLHYQLLYIICKYGNLFPKSLEGSIYHSFVNILDDSDMEVLFNKDWGMQARIKQELDWLNGISEPDRGDRDRFVYSPVLKLWMENLYSMAGHGGFLKTYELAKKLKKHICIDHEILEIIDGVDNILWHLDASLNLAEIPEESLTARELFKSCIEDIVLWAPNQLTRAEENRKVINLLVARPETIAQIIDMATDLQKAEQLDSCLVGNSHGAPVPISQQPIDFEGALLKKMDIINFECNEDTDKAHSELRDRYPELGNIDIGALLSDLHSDVSGESSFFPDKESYRECVQSLLLRFKDYVSQCKNLTNELQITNGGTYTLADIFNYNLRSFTFNFLVHYQHIAIYYPVLTKTSRYASRTVSNEERFTSRQVYREFFLSGDHFIQSTEGKDGAHKSATFMYNLFWYDTKVHDHADRWFGLVYIRIHQYLTYLEAREVSPTFDQVEFVLSELFGYPKKLIHSAIDKAITFGLISYFYEDTSAHHGSLRNTPKAGFCLHLSLSKIDMLYFLCLDTPVSSKIKSSLWVHSEIRKHSSNSTFLQAVLSGSYHMVGHINKGHRQDLDYALENMEKFDKKIPFGDISSISHCFRNPISRTHYKLLKKDFLGILGTVLEKEDSKFNVKTFFA